MADEELVPLAEGPGSPAAEESAAEPELTNPDEPMETLTVSLNKKKGGYGFNIKGGRDKPFREGDSSIYITRLRPGATAEKDGRLAPGDKILEINGNDVSDVTHSEALDLVRKTKGGKLTLLVQKRVIKFTEGEDGDDGLGVMSIQLHREKKGRGLGFNIRGGRDSPYVPEDPSIYVTRINSEGAAASDGRLSVGDKLLEINNVNVEDTTIDRAIDLIQSKKRLLLLVEKKALQRVVKTVREGAVDSVRGVENVIELYKDPEYGLGFNIRGGSNANYMRGHPGIFVTSIKPGGSADRDSRLKIGDRLLEINGVDVRSVPQDAAVQLVQRSVDKVTLLVEKDAEQLFKNSEFYSLSDFDEIDMSGEAGCFFRDQKRRIDFVLAYEEFDNEPASKETLRYRRRYMKNLQKSQLEFEEEQSPTKKGHLHFIKVHVPWEVMLFYAEELNFKGPLKARTEEKINWSERILKKFHLPNIFKDDVPDQPPNYFTATFQASKLQRFVGSDNPETYFKDTERTRVANEILETAVYGSRNKGEIGISRLVEEGVFTAAYPLHVGPAELPSDWNKAPDGPEERRLSQRQILKEYWARWGKWLKYQPLDHVREYFGEKIGIYFGWLGQYTAWLIPPSFVGLLVFLYGYLTIDSSQNTALEICNSANWTFAMCPLCEEELGCKAWDLKSSCSRARTSYLFDNPATVGYALFVAFWAVFFLEYWKRKEITLAYQWDVLGFEEEEERPRPTFAALAPAVERNPVTGLLEPHFPEEKRFPRIVSGIAIVICMVSLVVLFMVGVIVYKLLVIHPLYENPNFQEYASTIVSVTGSIMNLIIIMILSKVYEKLAYVLNHWEMHRTQTEYEDNLTFKVFVFQFMNFFASIFYIAFFKGKLVGYPGNYTKIFGLRTEQCSPGGCLMELAQQLSVIMIGKQVIGNVQEVLVPEIKKFMKKRKMGVTGNEVKPRWELDYDLLENEGLFGEYLEMVIQFGFVTIFVAAFPLAPFFALANNIFEIRIDSDKMVCDLRRPVAHRAQDIGIWFSMLSAIAKMAVISNAFLIAFTSQFLPKLLYRASISPDGSLHGYTNYSLAWAPANSTSVPCRYIEFNNPDGSPSKFYWHLVTLKLGFVILFEHFVFSVSWLIDMLVPDIPAGLDQAIKREAYQAKQIMSDNHGLMGGLPSSDDYMLELET